MESSVVPESLQRSESKLEQIPSSSITTSTVSKDSLDSATYAKPIIVDEVIIGAESSPDMQDVQEQMIQPETKPELKKPVITDKVRFVIHIYSLLGIMPYKIH